MRKLKYKKFKVKKSFFTIIIKSETQAFCLFRLSKYLLFSNFEHSKLTLNIIIVLLYEYLKEIEKKNKLF